MEVVSVDFGIVRKIGSLRVLPPISILKKDALSLKKLLEGVHKSSSESKPVNRRRRVVWRIRLASF